MMRSKRLFSLLLAAGSLFSFQAYAEEIAVDSTITAVTVYADRAKITREATVELPAGSHTVVFHGLPSILMPDSLRAEGAAKADVKFGAVANKMITSADLVAPREKELNDQLETLQDQRTMLQTVKDALATKKVFIESLGEQAHLRTDENIAQIDLKPDQWAAAAQTIYTNVGDILTAQVQQDIKIRTTDKQIEKIRRDIAGLRTGQKSTYDVTVPVESDLATKLTINVSYQVPNATWRPIYDARLETEKEQLALVEYGAVQQTTGEDWKGAALTLSTAQPQRGASLPDLSPLWVNVYTPGYTTSLNKARFNVDGGGANFSSIASNMAPAMEMKAAEAPVPASADEDQLGNWRRAHQTTSQIQSSGFVTEYKIPGPATVASDGTETRLMVGTFDTESKIQIHVKPQLSTDAFLVAKTKLKGDSPTLAGQVNLFRDGAYVGQDNLPLLRPGEEHGLYFGVDDQVAVKRKVLKDEKSEAGIIAKDNVLERNFITELQNLHSKPVEVVVKETSPVGQSDRISVEIASDQTTPDYEKDSANIKGLLQWTLPMAAKEKKDLKLGWKISWPKDMSLSGL